MSGYRDAKGDVSERLTIARLRMNMPEQPSVILELGPDEGNSTLTRLSLACGAGSWDFRVLNPSEGVVIEAHGDWERAGLIKALEFVVLHLKRAYDSP